MHVPEGSFKFKVGANNFEPILKKFGGPNAIKEWNELNVALEPIKFLAGAVPPLTLRGDPGVLLTLFPHLLKLLKGTENTMNLSCPQFLVTLSILSILVITALRYLRLR